MRKKLKAVSILMAATMVLSLTACGGSDSDSKQADSKDKEIYLFCESAEIADGIKTTTDKYAASHPGVSFVIETNSEDYGTNLKTKFAGSEEPDIFGLHGYSDAALYEEYLVDLSDQSWVSTMTDLAVENIKVNDKILGFPLMVEGLGYVYNAELFQNAGIAEVPKTFSEFKAACEKLTEAGISPISETYMDGYQGGYFFLNTAVALQDDPNGFMEGLSDGTSEIVGNKVFEDLADFLQYDYSQCENPMNTDYNTRIASLANREVAMTCGGNWLQSSFKEVDDTLDFKMMGMPIADDKDYDVIGISVAQYWGVNKNSDVAEEAIDFLNWLATDEEGQECLTTDLQAIPAFTDIEANEEAVGTLGASVSEYIQEGKTVGRYSSYFPDGVGDKWGEDVQKFVAGQITKDEFLKALEEDWYNLAN